MSEAARSRQFRLSGAIVTLLVLSSAAWLLTGWLAIAALLAAVVLPSTITWPLGQAGRATTVLIATSVAIMSVGFAVDGISDQYGAVNRIPIGGGSDQIDFMLMSWTWAEHHIPGTTAGGPAAQYVVDWVEQNGAEGIRSNLLNRWEVLAEKSDVPRPYAYRAHGYPAVLGLVWSVVGYRPELGAVVNILMLGIGVGAIGGAMARLRSVTSGLISGGSLAVASEPIHWAGQNLSETLTVMMMCLVVVASSRAIRNPSALRLVSLGLLLGLLALSKQMFFLIGLGLLIVATILVSAGAPRRWRRTLRHTLYISCAFLTVTTPWMAYNVATTASAGLLTGTAGWHDMPSAYSPEYLSGMNRFEVREQIFRDYETKSGQPLTSDIDRARAGREIWRTNWNSGEYQEIFVDLLILKIKRSISSDAIGWVLRAGAITGLIIIGRYGGSKDRTEALFMLTIFMGTLAFLALTIEDGPRLFVTSWVPVAALVGIGADVLVKQLETHRMQEETSPATTN